MTSVYHSIGCACKQESDAAEFTQNKADLLHKLIGELSRKTVQASISWKENSETAIVAFELKNSEGVPQMIRIRGDYFVLRTRIAHHLGGRQ